MKMAMFLDYKLTGYIMQWVYGL